MRSALLAVVLVAAAGYGAAQGVAPDDAAGGPATADDGRGVTEALIDGSDRSLERPVDSATLAGLLLSPPIGTPCEEDGAIVEIAGVGRAVYDRISYDGATGEARLSGSVCVELPSAGVRLRVGDLRITGLDPDGGGPPPEVTAREALLDVEGWRLRVARLDGPIDALQVTSVVVVAPGLIGSALAGSLRSDGGLLEGVSLATPDYLIQAREAELRGDELILRDASGTSCVCGVERYRLIGRTLRTRLSEGRATIDGPAIRILGVEIPLGDRLALDEDGTPGLELPVVVEERSGLGPVAVLRLRPSDGTRFELGAAGEPRLAPLALLRVRRGGKVVAVDADGRGLRIDGRSREPLGGGVSLQLLSVTDLQGDTGLLRAGVRADWTGRSTFPLSDATDLAVALDLRAGAEIAAEPTLDGSAPGTGPAAPRLPFSVEARLEAAPTPWAVATVAVGAEVVAYPGSNHGANHGANPGADPGAPEGNKPLGQAALRVAPALMLEGSDGRLRLSAERRWAAGASPFTFDELEPRFRLIADGTATAGSAIGPWSAEGRVAWRLLPEAPGAEDLSASLAVSIRVDDAWTLEPSLRTELAGLAGGDEDEDWLEARLEAVRDEDTRLGLRVREGVDPWTLRRLEAFAQLPIDLGEEAGGVRLVPYLAIDAAPVFDGGSVRLSAHGVRAYVPDCCGTLILGYRSDEDGLRFDLGVRLPPLELGSLPVTELPALPPGYGGAP